MFAVCFLFVYDCDGLWFFFISPQFKGLEKSLEIRIERLEDVICFFVLVPQR